jgi:glycosyltransferase involved in cell wall biosynthesis
MKILLSNKFYYRRGGDCIYTLNLEQKLKEHGHSVSIFAMQCADNLPSEWSKYWPSEASFKPGLKMLKGFFRPFGTKEVEKKFNDILDAFQPDIVHVGNIHSQLSPIIVKIAHERQIKVVWSIHDYKLLCPRYDFLKNGKTICEECLSNPHAVLDHNCVKNSRVASLLGYKESQKWSRKEIVEWTDAFICASDFVSDIMYKGGFPKDKLYTIMHSIDTDKCGIDSYPTKNERDYFCFIGRLSHEKGVNTLIDAANKIPYKLKVIGDGPLSEELKARANDNVEFLGFLDWSGIKDVVSKARFCVVPSEWYEVLGIVNLEALCLGSPVLGANIGSIPCLIKEGKNGMLFESGNCDDLVNKIEKMWISDFDYRKIAEDSMTCYSSDIYIDQLMKVYSK